MSVTFKMLIFYFLSLFYLVRAFWWSATESTTTVTTELPMLHAVTSEELYFQDKILQHQFIIPGTKYCGPGNKSMGPDDLGRFKYVDTCCRDHDSCPDNIQSGKYKHGLHNNAKFTKSHCSCDETFHHCLKDVGTAPARVVGALYFTIFHINCFKKDHPIIECNKRRYRRCLEYKLNFTADPVYQWFDNPFFRHWIDQFPPEMMNMSLLDLNISATTPMNMVDSTESITNLNITTVTESNMLIINSSGNGTNSTLETSNANAPYFGGYFQSFYDTFTNYLSNWTSSFTGKKEVVEITTLSNNVNVTNNTELHGLDYDTNSIQDFYVLN